VMRTQGVLKDVPRDPAIWLDLHTTAQAIEHAKGVCRPLSCLEADFREESARFRAGLPEADLFEQDVKARIGAQKIRHRLTIHINKVFAALVESFIEEAKGFVLIAEAALGRGEI